MFWRSGRQTCIYISRRASSQGPGLFVLFGRTLKMRRSHPCRTDVLLVGRLLRLAQREQKNTFTSARLKIDFPCLVNLSDAAEAATRYWIIRKATIGFRSDDKFAARPTLLAWSRGFNGGGNAVAPRKHVKLTTEKSFKLWTRTQNNHQ